MKEETLTQPEKRATKPFKKHRGKNSPLYELAQDIAKQLGEVDKKPRMQILHIARLCGTEFVQELVKETLEIEANGGMSISTGERRRTVGGIFFYLARERMSQEQRLEVFYGWQKAAQRRVEHEAQFPVFNWDERTQIVEHISTNKGGIAAMKVQISGQPGQIERRQNLVIFAMEQQMGNPENLPKGVPRPPETSSFTVYLSGSQWERVMEAVAQPDDELIVDGYCAYDPEIGMMAVYAHHATTKKLLKQEKNQKKPQPEAQAKKGKKPGGKGEAPKGGNAGAENRKRQDEPAAPLQVEINLPAGLPAPVAQKLTELYTAAASFRQKIHVLEGKPAGQQFGLEMTQKLLKNTEQQIEKLEKQYTPR